MSATIRKSNKRDLEQLSQLVYAFHEFHAAWLPNRLASLGEMSSFDFTNLLDRLSQILQDDEAAVFVAESNENLVGFIEVYLRQDQENSAVVSYKYGHVQSLLVLEKVRSKGIGKQLLQEAEKWAKSLGAEEIRLDTWEFEQGPLRFYERQGYETLRRTLVRKFE